MIRVLQYVLDYSKLLPLMSQELSTPGVALGPVSKPVARTITKMIAAQDDVSFSAVIATPSSSALALRLLSSCEELKGRTKRLILSSPQLPASLAKHLQESTATTSVTVLGAHGQTYKNVVDRMFPHAVHMDTAVKDITGLIHDIALSENPESSAGNSEVPYLL